MKPKHFDKKLNLQKTTVSNLDRILGGSELQVDPIKSTLAYLTCDCTVSRCWTQCPSIGVYCKAC